MTAMARLNRTWRCNTISIASKFKLYKSFVTSMFLYGCKTWSLLADSKQKGLNLRKQVPEEASPYLLHGARDQRLGAEQDQFPCGSTGGSSGNSQDMETCMIVHITRHVSFSKTILQGTLEVGDALVERANAGWTTSKSGHSCPFQNCLQGPPAKKTDRGSLLNRPPCPSSPAPDGSIGHRIELS